MRIVRDSSAIPSSCTGSVLALGNFDGLHLGHRAIVQKTLALARAAGKPAGVMTFEPHPRRVFRPELPPLRIFPFREKARLLGGLGVDFIRVVRFTRAFSETSAEQFITRILHEQMQVSHVVTGDDFTFGHNRTGNAAYLRDMAGKLGFGAIACAPVLQGGERCSSTRIRSVLSEGNMQEVAVLLGCPYSITGRVQEGDKRGRTIGFPTANIVPSRIFLPASGVYAVRVSLCHSHESGNLGQDPRFRGGDKLNVDKRFKPQIINGVANLGRRPTFAGTEMRLEVHMFDFAGDLYGQRLCVQLIDRIRGEQKFDGVAALKKQIAEDCVRAREILEKD
jgi:riboflavin kinase / FMN adenylyltransferase